MAPEAEPVTLPSPAASSWTPQRVAECNPLWTRAHSSSCSNLDSCFLGHWIVGTLVIHRVKPPWPKSHCLTHRFLDACPLGHRFQDPHTDFQNDTTLARVTPRRPESHYPSLRHWDPLPSGCGLWDLIVSHTPVRPQATFATRAGTMSISTKVCMTRLGVNHIVK